ncbi:MAG TPA: hypothetical protein PLB05_01370 [Candidatus Omnitrophota bacterium]|nr:hypothetical protein [Candidatus Omnitrophota bacterium]
MGHEFDRARVAEEIKIGDKEGAVSVILIGSFARGEALWIDRNGRKQCLSDVEAMAVLEEEKFLDRTWRRDFEKALKRALPAGIFSEASAEAASAGVVDTSVGFTTKLHLRRLKPHIFTLELKKFGKIICGDPSVLDLIPDYAPADLSRLDALVLLCNRIVEQLKAYAVIKRSPSVQQYLIDKGYVQVVNSLLSFEKTYCALYPEKQAAFEALTSLKGSPLSGLGLNIPAYNNAFAHIVQRDFPDIGPDKALEQWKVLRDEFGKALCHEVAEILKYDRLNIKEAVDCLVTIPNLMDCAKGWVKVFTRNQAGILRPGEIARSIWRTSPQFWIYRQAARLYFSEALPLLDDRMNVIEQWQRIVK